MNDSAPETDAARGDLPGRSLSFGAILGAAVLVLAIALLAAHLPATVKRIGLFTWGISGVCGALLAIALRPRTSAPRRRIHAARWILAALLLAAAMGALTAESYRLYLSARRAQDVAAGEGMTQLILERAAAENAELADAVGAIRRRDSFAAYLEHRYAPIDPPAQGVWWLFVGEHAVAVLVGLLAFAVISRRPQGEEAAEASPPEVQP